jgi:hypothetical protein
MSILTIQSRFCEAVCRGASGEWETASQAKSQEFFEGVSHGSKGHRRKQQPSPQCEGRFNQAIAQFYLLKQEHSP